MQVKGRRFIYVLSASTLKRRSRLIIHISYGNLKPSRVASEIDVHRGTLSMSGHWDLQLRIPSF